MAFADMKRWRVHGPALPAAPPALVPLVLPGWANQSWRHRFGGDGLLALAVVATILTALAGGPVRDLVPTLVLVPWLALWALPTWVGLGLAGAGLALARSRGLLDPVALVTLAGLWLVLVVVWLQNQGWLPWLFLAAWGVWAVAAGAALWQRHDGTSLAGLAVGLLALACLTRMARAHRPLAPGWPGWCRGRARTAAWWHTPRVAIGAAAAAVELSWLVGRPPDWALAIAVLLPWILLSWIVADPDASTGTWIGWLAVSATVVSLVAWSLGLHDRDRQLDLIAACAVLWGGLALAWMVSGRARRWLLVGGAAGGMVVAGVGWWQRQTPEPGVVVAAILAALGAALVGRLLGPRPAPSSAAALDPDQSILAVPLDERAVASAPKEQAPWVRASPGGLLAGKQAEAAMRQLLLSRLPAGAWVLSELRLPGLGGDVDLLVIGSSGVFVLEVKYWAGVITCGADGHAWTRRRRGLLETVDDPAGQLEREVSAVQECWWRRGDSARDVGGLLMFAHPRCEVEAAASPVPVVAPQDVEAVIRTGLPGAAFGAGASPARRAPGQRPAAGVGART
jgi:hypothetical protein